MKKNATILVVDDQPDLRDNIGLTLEAAGYRVLIAPDGTEALDVLQSQPVDLILADIKMPGINGYQLYERVRENPQWNAIPFIFLTARSLDSDIRYGKEMGVDDYLTKPIQPEDLLAAVRGKVRRAYQLAKLAAQPTLVPTSARRTSPSGRLKIDSHRYRVWLDEQEIKLTAREFLLLEHLARNEGKVVAPQALVQATHQLELNRVDAGALLGPLLHSLRRKLGAVLNETELIENVRSVGYRMVIPD